jgi:type II secretory pathway pseudopilin PulG
MIVAIMAGIAIMLILSTVAVQAWADVARRDAEAEMMFRAQDICRALKRFQTDRGKLPTELAELMEVGTRRPQYFLRQMWKDPLVKGGKWQLIYANPAGGVIDPSVPVSGQQTTQTGQVSIGMTPINPNNPGAGGTPTLSPSGDGSTQPLGLPIAGVKSLCKDKPFRRWKDKSDYAEWIFSIFDLDQKNAQAAQTPTPSPGAQPAPGQLPPVGQPPGASAPSFPPHN